MNPRWRIIACGAGLAVMLCAQSTPSAAKVVQATRTRGPGVGFLLGSGFELLSDSEQTEFGLAFLLELAVTPRLALTAEPTFLALRPADGETRRGFDDLDTTVSYELVSERRNRPALAVEGGVQWPTATHDEFGSGATDFALGALVNKEFIPADVGLDARYIRAGVPTEGQVRDALQLSLAGAWHVSTVLDLTGELLTTRPVGTLRGDTPAADLDPDALNEVSPGGEFEGTLGLTQRIGRQLQLGQDVTFRSDGSWQAEIAWEWDFGSGR